MNSPQPKAWTHRWKSIWQQNKDWLRTVLRARMRDSQAAEDLLQEVAMIAWKKFETIKDESRAAPWLYRIAIRQVCEHWRCEARQQKAKQRFGSDNADKDSQLDPLDWLTRVEIQQTVRNAMNEIGPQDREILMLKHAEGWSYRQISQRIGISHDKVVYRLERARKRLRQRLSALEQQWLEK